MKNVSILIPEAGPFGETLFEANDRAIVSGALVNNPGGGCVESVVTFLDHFFSEWAIAGKLPKTTRYLENRINVVAHALD